MNFSGKPLFQQKKGNLDRRVGREKSTCGRQTLKKSSGNLSGGLFAPTWTFGGLTFGKRVDYTSDKEQDIPHWG